MSTQAIFDAHQRNSTSTGPETEEKKPSASRYNAVKHGLTAKTPVLPNEDEAAYLDKVAAFRESLETRNAHEEELALRAAQASWFLDRANRSEVARMTLKMRTEAVEAEFQEAKNAASLGNRLFFDRRGPVDFYPSHNYMHGQPRTSWSEDAEDDPAMLVMELETTRAGCRWLLAQWSSLKALLVESGGGFQSHEKFKVIRLMGREPVNAISVREVAQVFLACHAIEPQHEYAFQEIRCETEDDRFKHYTDRLRRRNLEAITPADAMAARAVLLLIVDTAIERLRTLEAERQQVADIADGLRADILSVDESKSGYQLGRLKASCNRLLIQNLDAINKGRRAEASGWGRTREERGRRKEGKASRKPTGRLLMTDENGTTRYVDDYEREQELKARLAEACGADGWLGDEERLKAEGGMLSQRIAPEADFGDGAVDVTQDMAVPVMLTEAGEQAKSQNELDGSGRTGEGDEGGRAIEEGAEETSARGDGGDPPGARDPRRTETCRRGDGGDPPGARDPRRTEAVPVMLTETGERANLQNELDGSGRTGEGDEVGRAIEEGAEETSGRGDGGDPPGARDPRRVEERRKDEGGRMNQRMDPAAEAIVTGGGHAERSEMATTGTGGGDRREGTRDRKTAGGETLEGMLEQLTSRIQLLSSIGDLGEGFE